MLDLSLSYSSITKAVKAQARAAARATKAATAAAKAAAAAKRTQAPQYRPNVVNKRSDTLARIIAKGRNMGLEFPSKSMQICRRKAKHGAESVKVSVSEHGTKKHAMLHNVFMCKNSIHCPHCKAIAETKMRKYIAGHVSPRAESAHLASVMMTITMQHNLPADDADLLVYKRQGDAFYAALQLTESNSWRIYDKLGGGYMYGVETPMGSNGFHIHAHKAIFFDASLLEYDASGKLKDYAQQSKLKPHLDALIANVQAAFTKHDLHVSRNCIDVKMDFDLGYIAKSGTQEIDAKDSAQDEKRKRADFELTRPKDNHGRSNNREFVEYLDDAARGDKDAEREVLRHLLAMGGRRRWTVGQGLQKKLGLIAFSDWNEPVKTTTDDNPAADNIDEDAKIVAKIESPRFNLATELINQRPAIALILRAAKNEENHPGSVGRMVNALMRETVEAHAERITAQHLRRVIPLMRLCVNHPKMLAAILANAHAQANAAIADYYEEVKRKLNAKSDEALRQEIAESNKVGYDFINGILVKDIIELPTPQEIETMRKSMGRDLEFV